MRVIVGNDQLEEFMAAIWQESPGGKWTLLDPTGFPDEQTLHDLVAEAPNLLPLSGSPRLIVLAARCFSAAGMRTCLPSSRMAARSSSKRNCETIQSRGERSLPRYSLCRCAARHFG